MPRFSLVALVAVLFVAGCAPAAQLRVPAYTGPAIESARLLVLHRGAVNATPEASASTGAKDIASADSAVWAGFAEALNETYRVTTVHVEALPDSAFVPVFTSRQVVHERRAENRWIRETLNLPEAPLGERPAEFVLVLDHVNMSRVMGEDGFKPGRIRPRDIAISAAVAALTGVVVVPRTPVMGTALRAPYAIYRVGQDVPLVVGTMQSFAGGDEGLGERSALARSLQRLVSGLGESGALRER